MNKIIVDQDFLYGKCAVIDNILTLDITSDGELDISDLNYDSVIINVNACVFLLNINNCVKKYTINCNSNSYLEMYNFNNNNNSFDIQANLDEDSNIKIVTSTLSSGDNFINIDVNHNGYNSKSLCVNNGVVDTGSIVYNVKGIVNKNARLSSVIQDSKIISSDVKSASIKPILIIDSDVKEASHAASIGSYSDDVIFYLQSRGISVNDAFKLLNRALLLNGFKYVDEISKFI